MLLLKKLKHLLDLLCFHQEDKDQLLLLRHLDRDWETKVKMVDLVVEVEEMVLQEMVEEQVIHLQLLQLKELMVELQQQQVGLVAAVAVALLQLELVELVVVLLEMKEQELVGLELQQVFQGLQQLTQVVVADRLQVNLLRHLV